MVNFILGVLPSIIATAIWVAVSAVKSRKNLSNIKGYWLQEIPEYQDRPYSIGCFRYNRHLQCFTFDGTNYRNDGKPMNDWRTIYLHADLQESKLIYILKANKREEPNHPFYGFGLINLEYDKKGRPVPVNGFFHDALPVETVQHFSLQRIDRKLVKNTLGMHEGNLENDKYRIEIIRAIQLANNSQGVE